MCIKKQNNLQGKTYIEKTNHVQILLNTLGKHDRKGRETMSLGKLHEKIREINASLLFQDDD